MNVKKNAQIEIAGQELVALGIQQECVALRRAIDDGLRKVAAYEDAVGIALSLIPIDELNRKAYERVSALSKEGQGLTEERSLLEELCGWFKQEFFQWVNAPACDYCMGSTSLKGVVPASVEEQHDGGASRTELYQCGVCGNAIRFPRYNDATKLLETRKGRCGEWSNCFGLCCRATGYKVRLVVDFKDHVWNEVMLQEEGVWVHVDPCEGIVDKPLLYEEGWGKKVDLCVGVDLDTVADVTRRYVTRTDEENAVAAICCDVYTRILREGYSNDEIKILETQDEKDRLSMVRETRDSEANLPGRTTGTAEWIQQRGEDGSRAD